jgi:hypothetical protein
LKQQGLLGLPQTENNSATTGLTIAQLPTIIATYPNLRTIFNCVWDESIDWLALFKNWTSVLSVQERDIVLSSTTTAAARAYTQLVTVASVDTIIDAVLPILASNEEQFACVTDVLVLSSEQFDRIVDVWLRASPSSGVRSMDMAVKLMYLMNWDDWGVTSGCRKLLDAMPNLPGSRASFWNLLPQLSPERLKELMRTQFGPLTIPTYPQKRHFGVEPVLTHHSLSCFLVLPPAVWLRQILQRREDRLGHVDSQYGAW